MPGEVSVDVVLVEGRPPRGFRPKPYTLYLFVIDHVDYEEMVNDLDRDGRCASTCLDIVLGIILLSAVAYVVF